MKKIIEKYIDENYSMEVKDRNGNVVYYQDGGGFWSEVEYNKFGLQTHYKNSDGVWHKKEYDECGRQTYYINDSGEWSKSEYDSNGDKVFYENSFGMDGFDKRSKPVDDIVDQLKSLDQKQVIELIHLVIEQCHN
jgi:hypothetical protein